jgi:ubiquinone/menaquinone biosynthesis C-methylase UbiE
MFREEEIKAHYTHGDLTETIMQALHKMDSNSQQEKINALSGIDNFHMGGAEATRALMEEIAPTAQDHLLDIGSGTGGTARFISNAIGCQITGIDLTEEYVHTGNALNDMLGLSENISLMTGSATELPFPDASFDHACMLHVGMNIRNKAAVFSEACRALRPGARFAVYDVMQLKDQPLAWPVAWSPGPETSFLATPDAYSTLLESAGFKVKSVTSNASLALTVFERIMETAATSGLPPLGLHILMGDQAKLKLRNMYDNVKNGIIAPVMIISHKPI